MVEQAIDVGVSDPTAVAEAAPWRAVSHPGAVWGDAKSIVWWHFADVGESGATTVWNVLERAALTEAGCPLDEPGLRTEAPRLGMGATVAPCARQAPSHPTDARQRGRDGGPSTVARAGRQETRHRRGGLRPRRVPCCTMPHRPSRVGRSRECLWRRSRRRRRARNGWLP